MTCQFVFDHGIESRNNTMTMSTNVDSDFQNDSNNLCLYIAYSTKAFTKTMNPLILMQIVQIYKSVVKKSRGIQHLSGL